MSLNKQFKHGDCNFNIKVEFNTQIEKRINGKRYHTITCNCTDAWNYYDKRNATSEELVKSIADMENKARHATDLRNNLVEDKSDLEKQLIELGFK